jgi:hypothetical protein
VQGKAWGRRCVWHPFWAERELNGFVLDSICQDWLLALNFQLRPADCWATSPRQQLYTSGLLSWGYSANEGPSCISWCNCDVWTARGANSCFPGVMSCIVCRQNLVSSQPLIVIVICGSFFIQTMSFCVWSFYLCLVAVCVISSLSCSDPNRKGSCQTVRSNDNVHVLERAVSLQDRQLMSSGQ